MSGKNRIRFKMLKAADEPGFAMPVGVESKDHWRIIEPTTEWHEMKMELKKEEFQLATDFYYVGVKILHDIGCRGLASL